MVSFVKLEEEINSLGSPNLFTFSFDDLEKEIKKIAIFDYKSSNLDNDFESFKKSVIAFNDPQKNPLSLDVNFDTIIDTVKEHINADLSLSDIQKQNIINNFSSPQLAKFYENLKEIKKISTESLNIGNVPDPLLILFNNLKEIEEKFKEDIVSIGEGRSYNYGENYKLVANLLFTYYNKDKIENIKSYLYNELTSVSVFFNNLLNLINNATKLRHAIAGIIRGSTEKYNNSINKLTYENQEGFNELYSGRIFYEKSGAKGLAVRDLENIDVIADPAHIQTINEDKINKFNSIVPYQNKITDPTQFYFDIYLKLISYAQVTGNQELQVGITNFVKAQAQAHKRSEKIIEEYKKALAKILDKNLKLEEIPVVFSKCFYDKEGNLFKNKEPTSPVTTVQTLGVNRAYNEAKSSASS